MSRQLEIQNELKAIAAEQEDRALHLMAQAVRALEEVSAPNFPGRIAVRNEAARLKMVLAREAPSFARIVEQAS